MTDDEIYLACLLAIGPWDWEVQQTEFLMDQLNKKLGRRAAIDEGLAFINGYRNYSVVGRSAYDSAIGAVVTDCITKPQVKEIIDTHTVGE
ncbi:MAG: hypothetical protein QG672_1638 [Pseudomonadota bacterium]|jgi:hypothetical protein|nr:hypothetical protein [Pseudomonadota bacterium]